MKIPNKWQQSAEHEYCIHARIFICSACLHLMFAMAKQEAGNEKEETSCEKLPNTRHSGFFFFKM